MTSDRVPTQQPRGHGPEVTVTGSHVRQAAAVAKAALPAQDADWTVPVQGSRRTVSQTVARICEALFFYATDLCAGPRELDTVDFTIGADIPPPDLIRTMTTYAELVAAVVDSPERPGVGYHPWGNTDPSGFAAMAADEILIHAMDAAVTLGHHVEPPAALCRDITARLFPWVASKADPWAVLLWANGRAELPDHPVGAGWRWFTPPLEQWDGTTPERTLDGPEFQERPILKPVTQAARPLN